MTPSLRTMVCASLVILLLQVAVLAAEQPNLAPAAPVPQQILAAKKVFIANGGGDEGSGDPLFNGGSARVYNEFYAAVKGARRYEIVDSPADAELLFEIGLTATVVSAKFDSYDAQFRLVIRDPKTNALLWAFNEHMEWAYLRGNRERNFENTMAKIISDLQDLSASSNNAKSLSLRQNH